MMRLVGGVMPWLLAGLIGLSVFQHYQGQRVIAERDLALNEAEHQLGRAEVLQQHQRWQRQQIRTLNDSLAERDRVMADIADDIRASTTALERLGETDAEAREWMDRPVPGGIVDWVRELQRADAAPDSLRPVPHRAGPSNQ
ncbi:hypothetical protein [Vreelandella sp. GE22]